MIYALYVLRGNDNINEGNFDLVQKAFAMGKTHFIRWAFAGKESIVDAPEDNMEDINAMIWLEVENDRITPFATDEEIQRMFTILRGEGVIKAINYSQNRWGKTEIEIEFPSLN